MPDSYNLISGPMTISGITNGFDYYYHQFQTDEELFLEPGQILGFGGAQVGFRYY